MFKKIKKLLGYTIDGSRITIKCNRFIKGELTKEYLRLPINKDDDDYINLTIGIYTRSNKMFINPYYLKIACEYQDEDFMLKDLCGIISHEFLHMLLHYEQSTKVCTKFDNIAPCIDKAFIECGGI